MRKIRVAFIKFAGLSAGGTERWLQMMAAHLDRNRFTVDDVNVQMLKSGRE